MAEFIMMIGVPGSGKTTYADAAAAKMGKNAVVISSDRIRKELWGAEEDQRAPWVVFNVMDARTIEALENDKTVFYDATNVSKKGRKLFLSWCKDHKIKTKAIVMMTSHDECVRRDKKRPRTVGEKIIDKMEARFEMPSEDEFDEILIVKQEEEND